MTTQQLLEDEFGKGGLTIVGSHIAKKMKSAMIAFAKHHCAEQVKAILELDIDGTKYNEIIRNASKLYIDQIK